MSELVTGPSPPGFAVPATSALPSPRKERSSAARLTEIAAWVVATLTLLVLFNIAAVHAVGGSPDNATVLLEGQSISHGNLALQGWSLSLDSFWTVDALFYGAAVTISGLHPGLLFFVPALLAALVVAVAALISRDGLRGRAAVAAVVTVIALFALPGPDLAYYVLQGPWHVGTILWCLLAFMGLSRGRFGWGWVAAVVLFACGLLGDLLIVAFGIVPSFAAGLTAMLRTRRLRAGLAAVSAAFASLVVAFAIRAIADLTGTFTLANRNIVIRLQRVEANVGHIPNRLGGLLGVGTIHLKDVTNGAAVFQVFHVVGVVVVLAGFAAAGLRLLAGLRGPIADRAPTVETWRMDDLLVFAVLGDLVLFVWASPSGNLDYAKYLTAAVVFGAILGGRLIAAVAARIRSPRLIASSLAIGALVLGAFAVEFAGELTSPTPAKPTVALGSFLASHGLHVGVGDYWSSSLVTVETDGAVAVRPVNTDGVGQLIRFNRQSSLDWYVGTPFQFFVYDTARPWHGVNATSAKKTFGAPARTYKVGTYRVLVWNHDLSVAIGSTNSGSPLQIFWR